jgi:hypothetical protein
MESSVVLKTAFVTIVAIIVPALIFGCVRDVKTESATDFSLVSGQTWDWFPDKVKTWQQYKRGESMADLDKAELRALKREHKHIQKSIQRELSVRGGRRVEERPPTYHVAYYLFPDGHPVAARDYAPYEGPAHDWEDPAEDVLVIDIVDPASRQLLWSGSGAGNTRAIADVGSDQPARMRGVKEAVRHIMRDLK